MNTNYIIQKEYSLNISYTQILFIQFCRKEKKKYYSYLMHTSLNWFEVSLYLYLYLMDACGNSILVSTLIISFILQ